MRSWTMVVLGGLLGCTGTTQTPDVHTETPVDPRSPWPKFRGTARQDGRGAPTADEGAGKPWSFQTTKGIFASPVIDGDGTVYVGSADESFHSIDDDGVECWSLATGEIIDSAALLDDGGRVIFGSGDGHVYARYVADGAEAWTFTADNPQETGGFINWFEGNIAILPGGDLVAPNDDFRVYGIDRQTGSRKWAFTMGDQTWSSPAVDPVTSQMVIGNNNLLESRGGNVYAIGKDGSELWRQFSGLGSIAASPMLTHDGKHLIVGSFDGYVRSLSVADGSEAWKFGARDHFYASPAALSDGTIIQPSADGTVYALDPDDGSVVWAFDTEAPIRSSPAVGGDDVIYVGGGDGKLYVLNPEGTLRWSMKLIDGDRDDLNASPALGPHAVVVAGESGQVFRVPYDWCLGGGKKDPKCATGGEDLPSDATDVYFTDRWGNQPTTPPTTIGPVQPLAFSLVSRVAGDTQLALLDADHLTVTIDPDAGADVVVSPDRRFLSILPQAWVGDSITVTIAGTSLVDPDRTGLAFTGGTPGPTFSHAFTFTVDRSGPAASEAVVAGARWAVRRLAAPLPTLLPSYNQIGFDSLHYEVGVLDPQTPQLASLAWMIGANPDGTVDPTTQVRLPLDMATTDNGITLRNHGGMKLEAMNLTLSFDDFRIAASLDDHHDAIDGASVWVSATCGHIPFYGVFLRTLGLCNPQTDGLGVWGGVLMESEDPSPQVAVTDTTFALSGQTLTATFTPDGFDPTTHVLSVVGVDASGAVVPADYGTTTTAAAVGDGTWQVSVPLTGSGAVTFALIVDTRAVAVEVPGVR